jgi:hypothetical protein
VDYEFLYGFINIKQNYLRWLGYVALPIAVAFAKKKGCYCFDIKKKK